MIKTKIKVKMVTLDVLLLLITLEEWPMMNHQIYTVIKYGIIFYMLIRYSLIYFELAQQNTKIVFSTVLLLTFAMLTTVSTMQYTHKLTWAVSALMNALCYMALFEVLFSIAVKFGAEYLYKVIVVSLLSVLLFNDLLIMILPYDLHSPSEQYLIGNKFAVSYYHCFAMIISKSYAHVCTSDKRKTVQQLPVILGVLSITICAIVHCSTGLLISIFSLFMILMPLGLKKIVCSKLFVSALLLIENILIFGSAQLFTHPVLQFFFVNVLGKSPNMTGRFKIYGVVDSVIAQKPLLGFGYNTVTDIITALCGYGNAQNGIKQLLIQFGYIGTGILLSSLFIMIGKESNRREDTLELYIMLYALVIASTVEITLSTLFVFVVALIGAVHLYYAYERRNTAYE